MGQHSHGIRGERGAEDLWGRKKAGERKRGEGETGGGREGEQGNIGVRKREYKESESRSR